MACRVHCLVFATFLIVTGAGVVRAVASGLTVLVVAAILLVIRREWRAMETAISAQLASILFRPLRERTRKEIVAPYARRLVFLFALLMLSAIGLALIWIAGW